MTLTMEATGRVVNSESGKPYRLAELIDRLPWRQQGGPDRPASFDPHTDIPLHQYVVRGQCDREAYDVLLFAINKHPESYRGYFRGYQYPSRYLEIDGYRYWPSMAGPVQMLNRCTFDSVEPPRRVDEGARPICWQEWGAEQPYLPRGNGWSEEYRRAHTDLFDPSITPPCAHGVIETGDRVKHLASRRHGTVVESDAESATAQVRWDGGKTSRVDWKGLRTQCCLPREPLGPAPEIGAGSGEIAASPPSARERGSGAGELHLAFWTQFAQYLETKESRARLSKPTRKAMANAPRGPAGFRLAPWNLLSGTSGIGVRWDGPDADAVVERLDQERREELTAKLSPLGEVVWLRRDSKGSLLSLRRPSAVSDRSTWPELNRWLAGGLETLWALLERLEG